MPLSWNEIKSRAIEFSKEWEGEERERAEKDSFWNDFFNVFGISRRRVASFEKAVKKLNNRQGYIDLFWKGTLLIEHKSKGRDLDKAFEQALDYFPGLKEHELPKFILVSDFETFRLYDLEEKSEHEFALADFINHIHLFGFIAGYEKRTYKDEDPVNLDAAYLMGNLHDKLKEIGYTDHALEVYLVRLLFCLFADDTGIFERGVFQEYIDLHTKEDGSDLAMHIGQIFQVLNTPKDKRLSNLDESLNQFPYINGQLFEETLPFAAFNSKMREMLLEACGLDWGKISPAIFGSMFQAAMNQKERRNLGAHYTSEKNIQKLIKPLFLDELHEEFEKAKGSTKKLQILQNKIANLKFLDPACGCGNFLIITYRELRELEVKILRELYKTGQGFLNVGDIIQVDVDQFYGIEYDEFPARIAEVAMWLMDHQMNMKVSEEFGQYFVRLPLKKAATIVHGNALRVDWNDVIPAKDLSYILGNPPFIGAAMKSKEQILDVEYLFRNEKNYKKLDYVAGWFYKSFEYISFNKKIKAAFVSTNSITQGEQVPILWKYLEKKSLTILFAHTTFKWNNEAKGKAAVHCVIVGYGIDSKKSKKLYTYESVSSEPVVSLVNNINYYLLPASNLLIEKRKTPISNTPLLIRGNIPYDNGYLLFSKVEKENFVKRNPSIEPYVKKYGGAYEMLNDKWRYCLWLKDCPPHLLKESQETLERIDKVRIFRKNSKTTSVKRKADSPSIFGDIRQPNNDYILFPRVSSFRRKYLPLDYIKKDVILADSAYGLPNADFYLFGILMSTMHNIWFRTVCGRLKSDYRYSNIIVFNNFPFPRSASEKNKNKVEQEAKNLLDIRKNYKNSSLSDLYDPLTMPPDLAKAHRKLDKAVDLCYRPQVFTNERNRIEFLFQLYEEYTNPLLNPSKK